MQNQCVGRFYRLFCVVCSWSRESHVIVASRDSKSWKSWRLDCHESRVVTTSCEVIKTPSQVVLTISTTWKKRTISYSLHIGWSSYVTSCMDKYTSAICMCEHKLATLQCRWKHSKWNICWTSKSYQIKRWLDMEVINYGADLCYILIYKVPKIMYVG